MPTLVASDDEPSRPYTGDGYTLGAPVNVIVWSPHWPQPNTATNAPRWVELNRQPRR
jgi:hypothetical protein